MVLPVERSDVRAAKCTSALVAEQAEASEVVGLAQGVLAAAILVFCREELRCDYRTAVLHAGVSLFVYFKYDIERIGIILHDT